MTAAAPMRAAANPHGPGGRGSSLIEVLVSVLLLAIITTAAYASLISQMRAHATQTVVAELETQARTALRTMAEQIEMAGFGVPLVQARVPSVADSIITAEASRLSFWAGVRGTHTFLTANAVKYDSNLQILSAASIRSGDKVYITDAKDWYYGTVQSASGTTLTVTPGLTYAFALGALVVPVQQVTFELSNRQLLRNGHPLLDNVTALNFTYDSQSRSLIRQVTVAVTAETRRPDTATGRRPTVTLTTRVVPPNLAM